MPLEVDRLFKRCYNTHMKTAHTVTGWDTGLCQDYHTGLARWFAGRLGARYELRLLFARG